MKYLQKENGKITCTHPSVKEIKEFGSTSAAQGYAVNYNLQILTNDDVEYRETGNHEQTVVDRMESILQSLPIK